jgi:Mg/Co/Ni transporter MgtE
VKANASAAEVARTLASYNLVSLPVVDENHRLVGVVTIDDILDYLLPDDWRSHDDDPAPENADTSTIPVIAPAARRSLNGSSL